MIQTIIAIIFGCIVLTAAVGTLAFSRDNIDETQEEQP